MGGTDPNYWHDDHMYCYYSTAPLLKLSQIFNGARIFRKYTKASIFNKKSTLAVCMFLWTFHFVCQTHPRVREESGVVCLDKLLKPFV